MSMVQRLGWLLLGLLLLAGAMHAPLHQEGQDCGLFALCGNGVVMMWATGLVVFLVLLGRFQARGCMSAPTPENAVVRVGRGRAPPRSR